MSNRVLFLLYLFAATVTYSVQGATTFIVTTDADSGAGSLRQAIIDANATPGADSIEFNIASGGEQTIVPLNVSGPFPAITEPLTIDGTTQPGFSGKALIEIDGANVTS